MILIVGNWFFEQFISILCSFVFGISLFIYKLYYAFSSLFSKRILFEFLVYYNSNCEAWTADFQSFQSFIAQYCIHFILFFMSHSVIRFIFSIELLKFWYNWLKHIIATLIFGKSTHSDFYMFYTRLSRDATKNVPLTLRLAFIDCNRQTEKWFVESNSFYLHLKYFDFFFALFWNFFLRSGYICIAATLHEPYTNP